MTIGTDMRNEVDKLANDYGRVITIKYLNVSGGSAYYDDNVTYTVSGTLCVSGIFLPKDQNDNVLVEQGIIHPDDKKLYLPGDIDVSGTITIQAGSKTGTVYSVVPIGIGGIDVGTDTVYNKIFLRRLSTGSLLGEI